MTMGIKSGFGQLGYGQFMDEASEGDVHGSAKAREAINPRLEQITVIAFTGAIDDGAYTVNVKNLVTDEIKSATFTRPTDGNPANYEALATELADAWNADVKFRNVVTFDNPASPANALRLVFDHVQLEYEVTFSAPGTAIGTPSTTPTGGVILPFGRFAVLDEDAAGRKWYRLPQVGDTGPSMRAVIGREFRNPNEGSSLASAVDGVQIGKSFPAVFDGKVYMRNVGPAAAAQFGDVHVVINTAGGQDVGQARASADGANTVAVANNRAYWADDVPSGGYGWVYTRL